MLLRGVGGSRERYSARTPHRCRRPCRRMRLLFGSNQDGPRDLRGSPGPVFGMSPDDPQPRRARRNSAFPRWSWRVVGTARPKTTKTETSRVPTGV